MTKPTAFKMHTDDGHLRATWAIHAPWAHPVWQEYAITLYDLRDSPQFKPAVRHMPGVTHEFMLYAVDPAFPYSPDFATKVHLLSPPNLGYQFIALDDEAAVRRVRTCVEMIEAKTLSPDTDFRSVWDDLFKDGVPLVRSMFNLVSEAHSGVVH